MLPHIMNRILYFSHVPWDWVKQRPHFIAEGLARTMRVSFCSQCSLTQFLDPHLTRNPFPAGLERLNLYILPFRRSPIIAGLNKPLIRFQLRRQTPKFTVFWFTAPFFYNQLARLIPPDADVIYDCMDDVAEFPHIQRNRQLRAQALCMEEELLRRATTVFSSSSTLAEVIRERYQTVQAIHVVGNASNNSAPVTPEPRAPLNELLYVGTVSEWLDMNNLLVSLKRFPQLSYRLIGPKEVNIPRHPRLRWEPPIPHDRIPGILSAAQALIMPFRVTKLVKSVDPVKLYEFVASGRPSIAVDYPETHKFAEFVHLYKTDQDFLALIRLFLEGQLSCKGLPEQRAAFVNNNTWDSRVQQICRIWVPTQGTQGQT